MKDNVVKILIKYLDLFTSQRFTVALITILVMTFGFKENDVTEIIKAISMVAVSAVTILSYAVRKPGETNKSSPIDDTIDLANKVNKYFGE